MKKLLVVGIVVLAIWNLILTVQVNKLSETKEIGATIVENEVNGFSTDLTRVIDEVKSTLVAVKCDNSFASGVIYAEDDNGLYIITNYHVIENESNISVILDNYSAFSAKLVGYDKYTDIAVLNIKPKFDVETIKLGDSSLLKSGEFIIALGNPLGIDYRGSVSLGIVSSNNRIIETRINNRSYLINMIQSDVLLNDGNSGGPLVNMAGELVGINTFSHSEADGLSFALPVNELKLVCNEIINDGSVSKTNLGLKPYAIKEMPNYQKNALGIRLDQINGLYISGVKTGFMGSYLGVIQGDILLKVNDVEVDSIDDYIKVEYEVLDKVKLEVMRNGEILTFEGVITND